MRQIDACRACGQQADTRLEHFLFPVLDLGDQYLSDFRRDQICPPRCPLKLVSCVSCGLMQLEHTADFVDLYHDRYSFKSGVSDAIRLDLMNIARYALNERPGAKTWLDIGSNDGTLLSFVPRGIQRVGIDPLHVFADEARQHAEHIVVDGFHINYFTPGHPAFFGYDKFDVITSISMFYDIDQPVLFAQQVAQILAPDGVWIIQQNYLPSMLANTSYDNISHEHLCYYTLGTLTRVLRAAGLQVKSVSTSEINGGCFRTVVTHTGQTRQDPSVGQMLDAERSGVTGGAMWAFVDRVTDHRRQLNQVVHRLSQLVKGNRRIYVYGASTRGAVMWQAAGLDHTQLSAVVDRNPDKVGRYMSAIGAPIISEQQMRADPPDYLLVGPWWLADDFIQRERAYLEAGGEMIIPLPQIRIVGKKDLERE